MAATMDSLTRDLSPTARAHVEELLQKNWRSPGKHPLRALHDVHLGSYRLIVLLGPKSSVGSQSFQLLLADAAGSVADAPLAVGLFNRGPYPAFNWLELTLYDPAITLGDRGADLRAEALELPFFWALSGLVPPGGHIMVEYDSPSQRATARILTLGYPEVTSPTGYLLFQVGCRSFKNWHISEGGREGPRKLQGFKPWNDEIRREKTRILSEQLAAFLAEPPNQQHGEWEEIARRNAAAVAEALNTEP
jgi:hypothetical protein